MIRDSMTNGIVKFTDAQILNLATTKMDVAVVNNDFVSLSLGKNAKKLIEFNIKNARHATVDTHVSGNYFYWYTSPLTNYYHLLLDGVGCLARYFDLKEQLPDLKLMLNQSPRPKGGVTKHPPFVIELLELFGIDWEYTDEHTVYDTVYYGDTLAQDRNGKRTRPLPRQYELLKQLITTATARVDVPSYDKIYLSRRAHANPLANRKSIVGEDNTVKRGLVNEDAVVGFLTELGYTEVFGENYTLAEKIVLFSKMKKYISTAGAGVANILWTIGNNCSVGGIHTPGFPFPVNNHDRHICMDKRWLPASVSIYPGAVSFVDPAAGAKNYNNPWYINDLDKFNKWAASI